MTISYFVAPHHAMTLKTATLDLGETQTHAQTTTPTSGLNPQRIKQSFTEALDYV
jgi:hypothetical protein